MFPSDPASAVEPQQSSRSASPGPSTSEPLIKKQPPIVFYYGEDRVRKMLPQRRLPRCLDYRFVDVALPSDLPLCWVGVPVEIDRIHCYARKHGLDTPASDGPCRGKPGSIDLLKTWCNIVEHFYSEYGVHLEMKEVWGHQIPILVCFSNREMDDITYDKTDPVREMLKDMEYGEDVRLMWYLDAEELF